MNNRDMELRLAKAVEGATPDVLDKVLERINAQEQPPQPQAYQMPKSKVRILPFPNWISVAAAVLLIVFGGFLGYNNYAIDTVIDMDVNPSIQVQVNRFERVRRVESLNKDADAILAGMNLKNVELDVAINALIGSMLRGGYLSEAENAILVSVKNRNAEKGLRLQEQLAEEINALLQDSAIDGAVISQALSEDEQIRQLAEESGISLGKAALIDLLIGLDDTLSFGDLAGLPISDIYLLLSAQHADLHGVITTGSAAGRYVDEEEAIAISLEYAGAEQSGLTALKIRLGFEDGHMVYHVEFSTEPARFLFLLDAETGGILNYEKEFLFAGGQAIIGEAQARAIAMKHAGVAEGAVISLSLSLDEVTGLYLLEFRSGGSQYSYQVDAVTGEIAAYEWALDEAIGTEQPLQSSEGGESAQQTEGEPSTSGGTAVADVIGEARAKEIALEHAGVSASQVNFVKAEQYTKQQVRQYDLVFLSSSTRYSYQIEAYTGEVLAVYTSPSYGGYGADWWSGYGNDWTGHGNGSDGHGHNNASGPNTGSDSYIGEAEAKSAALAHSGVSESVITKYECKLKSKSGRMVYEIEFRTAGDDKYEYLVDAVTGDVVEWQQK